MVDINRLLSRAKEKGISQTFIAAQVGRKANYLTNVKRGIDSISDERLCIIARILDTTVEYLKGETDEKEKPLPEAGKGNGPLTDAEQDVIAWYRSAPPEVQAMVRKMAGLQEDEE